VATTSFAHANSCTWRFATGLVLAILRPVMVAPSITGRVGVNAQRGYAFSAASQRERASAFTLLELLIVIGIIGLLLVLIAPAFTYIKGGTDVTSAAYTIQGVLDTARTYAKANNTYTWVGFFEENAPDPSTSPANSGTGRIVMSIVASKDGTMLYTTPLTDLVTLPSTSLIQVGKLTKVDNVHLKTFSAGTGTPPADTFDTRPAVASTASQIGDTDGPNIAPPNPSLQFAYPLGGSQYTFAQIIQFNPRGEGVIDDSNYTMSPVSEIGIQPTHGTTIDANSTNFVAIQFTGFGGNVKVYRK
jgi:type II secretory pathway pseudopilin PulG